MEIADLGKSRLAYVLSVAECKWARKLQEETWDKTGDGAYALGELLENGEFDANTTGWTVNSGSIASVSGGVLGNCLRITGSSYPSCYQTVTVEPLTHYIISFYAKEGTEVEGFCQIEESVSGYLYLEAFAGQLTIIPGSDWKKYTFDFVTGQGASDYTLRVTFGHAEASTSQTFYFDRIWLRKAADEPQFPHTVINLLVDDGEYSEVFSLSDVDTDTSSWYWDAENKRLFVHTAAGDSPAELVTGDPKYSVVAEFIEFYSNLPEDLEYRRNVITNGSLDWWADDDDCDDWTEVETGTSTVRHDSTAANKAGSHSAYSAKFSIDASGNYIDFTRNDVYLRPGSKVKIRLWHKDQSTNTLKLSVIDFGTNVWLDGNAEWATGSAFYTIPNSTAGEYHEVEFVVHPDYDRYSIHIQRNTGTSCDFWVDDIEVWQYYPEQPCRAIISSMPTVYQGVGDFFTPDARLDFGTLELSNPEYFAKYKDKWLWHNRPVRLWLGEAGIDGYDDFAAFGVAVTRMPKFKPTMEIELDDRQLLFETLPLSASRFDSTTYPNVEDNWKDRPVPVLLGRIYRSILPQCNTSTKVFKISQTTFKSGTNYPLQSVAAVYKNGTALTLTTDYTVNLTNGTITLVTSWAAGDVIDADAVGVDRSFKEHTGSKQSELLSGFLIMLWVEFNGVSKDDIDAAALFNLDTDRVQPLSKHIKSSIKSDEFLTELKISTISHTFLTLDGKLTAKYFDTDIPSDAPHFKMGSAGTDNKTEPEVKIDTDQCRKWVAVRSQYREYFGDYRYEEVETTDHIETEHGVTEGETIDSVLGFQLGAGELAENYAQLFSNPPQILEVVLGAEGLVLQPFDKAYFTWKEINARTNFEYTYLDEKVFIITEIDKNVNEMTARIVAMEYNADFFWIFS